MMPDVYKDVFTMCGKNYEDYIELRQLRIFTMCILTAMIV
ncbi:Dehydrosqualene desaturase (Diapophytoene desaturase) (4,4-diapophytoene desaturase) [Staphylococcus aureus]|uniref:Dehydrosqualene desaturase (Diapophytoene desaturase) (4,4-diapophytoene desaturase) n=1 Tax=Staphylococcus aureus TaxID=1280 RepID=A0A2X2K1R6_STAAU|nr:Dehydrosqualene desaturase (Diapophytoene desaturase) (4,4-diapophytoene desaturase) [Staphylococcus aureus]